MPISKLVIVEKMPVRILTMQKQLRPTCFAQLSCFFPFSLHYLSYSILDRGIAQHLFLPFKGKKWGKTSMQSFNPFLHFECKIHFGQVFLGIENTKRSENIDKIVGQFY